MLSELSSIIWSNYAYSYVRKFGPFLKRTNRGKNHKMHRPDIDTANLWAKAMARFNTISIS